MTSPTMPIVMPDLLTPLRLGRHTLDSALSALRARGLPDDCVRIFPIASGSHLGTVIGQVPAAGEAVDPRVGAKIFVEAAAVMDRLPYALRDDDPDEFGIDQILGLFDSSASHAGHYLRRGGDLFALREGDAPRAKRWLEEIFAIDPSKFARERWYRVVRLAARLHVIGGRIEAVPTAIRAVYDMPVRVLGLHAGRGEHATLSGMALGGVGSQLGFQSILGGMPSTSRDLSIEIGPVSLEQFLEHDTPVLRAERQALYGLCLPFWIETRVHERWTISSAAEGMRLGEHPGTAPRLGWTSYVARTNG